jgi:alpha-D-ribose 1-methylphosphonate 5-triphosphate synthase subunit PhnL
MTSNVILRVIGLSKSFFIHEQGKCIPSAQNVSLEVQSEKLTALIGTSGTGKSSILKCIYRTYLPSCGNIYYHKSENEWIDLTKASECDILKLRRTEIAFVTQFLYCLPRQSTVNVVAKPLLDLGMKPSKAREIARESLNKIKLPERLWDISPYTFSGGEKQRVNLARAIIICPRLLLLDEPTASLDSASTAQVVEIIRSLKKANTGILAVFHNEDLVNELADTVIKLTES